jgi:hypothetical protein
VPGQVNLIFENRRIISIHRQFNNTGISSLYRWQSINKEWPVGQLFVGASTSKKYAPFWHDPIRLPYRTWLFVMIFEKS